MKTVAVTNFFRLKQLEKLCIQGSPRCYLLYMASWRPCDRAQSQEGCSEGFEEIKSCLSWKMGDDELRVVSPSKGC